MRGVLLVEQHAVSGRGVVDFPGAEYSCDGCEEVGDRAGEAHIVCFARNTAEAKCLFDDVLFALVARFKSNQVYMHTTSCFSPEVTSPPLFFGCSSTPTSPVMLRTDEVALTVSGVALISSFEYFASAFFCESLTA